MTRCPLQLCGEYSSVHAYWPHHGVGRDFLLIELGNVNHSRMKKMKKITTYCPTYILLHNNFIDIDECSTQNHDYSLHALCTNVEGSFQCECEPGFTGDGKTCNGRLWWLKPDAFRA